MELILTAVLFFLIGLIVMAFFLSGKTASFQQSLIKEVTKVIEEKNLHIGLLKLEIYTIILKPDTYSKKMLLPQIEIGIAEIRNLNKTLNSYNIELKLNELNRILEEKK